MRKRHVARILPAVVLVALLAGCAPAVTPTASPVAGGSSVPAPTPTPTPTSLSAPVVRVSIGCNDLVALSAVDTAAADPGVVLRADQTAAPSNLLTVALRQRGTLQCVWGGKTQTDGGYDNGLTVSVAVDAAAQYATDVPLFERAGSAPTAINTAGDQSEYSCNGGNNSFNCGGNVLVGTFWATASLQHSYGEIPETNVNANARMQQVLHAIAAALGQAQTLPAWSAPAATLSAFCANASENTAKVQSILADPKIALSSAAEDSELVIYDATAATTPADAITSCNWTDKADDNYLGVDELPNGAWALPMMAATPPYLEGIGTYKQVTVPGADITLFVHGGEGASDAIFSIGANAYDVEYNDYGTARDTAILTALVAQLAS